jgi:secreted trypsin-like serine protease
MEGENMRKRSLVVGLLAGAATAVAVAVVPSAFADDSAGVTPKIVGGGDADQTYSFMVSLQEGGQHFCGGSLIKPDLVVTAAHCVEGTDPASINMRIGSNEHANGGEEAQAASVTVHPDYDGQSPGNDIALVKLAAPAASAPIPLAAEAPVGTKSRLLGWGQTCPEPGGCGAPDILQQLDVEVLDAGQCTGIEGSLELCTSNPNGNAGACYGDSGGPQIVGTNGAFELIGVTSRSGNGDSTCATGPSIYTATPAYADFINSGGA